MPYIGRDQLTHQETIIDWDLKTKISAHITRTEEEKKADNQQIKDFRKQCLADILAINPAMAGELYSDYVIRDYEKQELRWDVPLIEGRQVLKETESNTFIYDMWIILTKRAEDFKNHNLSLKTPQIK